MPQPNRLGREIGPCERLARRSRVAFVEHEIDHRQDRVEPLGQIGQRRDDVRNPRVADLGFAADDALGDRRGCGQKGTGDRFGREAADFPQREGDLRAGGECRVAAGEDQPQLVILDALIFTRCRRRRALIETSGQFGKGRVEPRAAAEDVDRFEAAGRDQPRAGIGRDAVPRPLLDGRRERVVQRLFRQVEVAENSHERGEDTPRLGAVNVVDRLADDVRRLRVNRQRRGC